MSRIDGGDVAIGATVVALVGAMATCLAAWVTHIIWVIKILSGSAGATEGQIVLGILGLFVPPIGVIHGFMVWFGAGG